MSDRRGHRHRKSCPGGSVCCHLAVVVVLIGEKCLRDGVVVGVSVVADE
jgi:hypothetical protein